MHRQRNNKAECSNLKCIGEVQIKGPVSNYRRGAYKTGGRGQVNFYRYKKEWAALTMLGRMHTNIQSSFNVGTFICGHAEGWLQKVSIPLKGDMKSCKSVSHVATFPLATFT